MSKNSSPTSKSIKNQQSKLANQEQLLAGLVALPAGIQQDAALQTGKSAPKNKIAETADALNEKEFAGIDGSVDKQSAGTELAVSDEILLDLAFVEDPGYTVTSNKKQDDDDDGAWWWLKGLALLGGVALLAGGGGGGGSSPAPVDEFDHLSFIDEESNTEDGDDVLVMASSRTISNLTLVAPENQQTEDSSGGIAGLLDEEPNSQYVFVGGNDGVRTLNLRVSDEDNVALGLFLDSTLDESGYALDEDSAVQSVNILVDENSILQTAVYYEGSGGSGGMGAENLIDSDVDGRSFSIDVLESSRLYAEENVIENDGNNVVISIAADEGSDIESGWSMIDNNSDNLDVSIDLTSGSYLSAAEDGPGVAVVESVGDDLTVDITMTDSEINAGDFGSGGSGGTVDESIVYSEGNNADINLSAEGSLITSTYSTVYSEGDNALLTVDVSDSTIITQSGNDGSVIDSIGADADITLNASDSYIESDWLIYAYDSGGATDITVDLTRTDVRLGEMGIEASGDDLEVSLTALGEDSGGNYLTVDSGDYDESGDVIYVEGSNANITVDMTNYNVVNSGGSDDDIGADDFVRVDAHDQIDAEDTNIDVTLTSSDLMLDDDLIDFDGEKLDLILQVNDSSVSSRDHIIEIDSSRNDVSIEAGIAESFVGTEYGHFVDIRDAANLELSLSITDSILLNELASSGELIGSVDDLIDDLDRFRDVSLINVQDGLLKNVDIDLSASSSTLLLDQHYIQVSSLERPTDSDVSIALTLDSVFAVTGDDAIAVTKNEATIDVNLHYAAGYMMLDDEYDPVSISYTGDDFIDVVGDDAVINATLSSGELADPEIDFMGYQVHFVHDDFVDITGRDAQVTFAIEDQSVVVLGTNNEFGDPYLVDINGNGAHTVTISMLDNSLITNGEDGISGGFFGGGFSGGTSDTFGLVKIDNELLDDDDWDGSNDAEVTVTLSDNARIDADGYSSGGYSGRSSYGDYSGGFSGGSYGQYSGGDELIHVDSSNAHVSLTLNDESSIEARGDVIYVNTNLYNSANNADHHSDISLSLNGISSVNSTDGSLISTDGSLIQVDFEHEYYVGEDLTGDDGYGHAASVNVTLDVNSGTEVDARYNLINIEDDDGREDRDNTVTAERLDRNVTMTISDASAYSGEDAIFLEDLAGFDVRVTVEEDASLETANGALIHTINFDSSYINLDIIDSTVIMVDTQFEDSLVFLNESDYTDVFINIENSKLEQGSDSGGDYLNIFSAVDSDDLNVTIRIEDLSGEEYFGGDKNEDMQVIDLQNVDDSVFNVTFYDSLDGTDNLYFNLGRDNWDAAATDNILNVRLIDNTDSGSLDDVIIDVNGYEGYGFDGYGDFNTVNLDLQEIDLDNVDVYQTTLGSGGFSGGFMMTTDLYLERSIVDDLFIYFDKDVSGGDSGGYNAELYMNLNNSTIYTAALDVYEVDSMDFYTQGTRSSFIQIDVNLMEEVDYFNVYSLGATDFDYQINISAIGNDSDMYDGDYSSNAEGFMTEINLAVERNGGSRNYDYLDIEYIEMTQVNSFETAAGRDKIYNRGTFEVDDLTFSGGFVDSNPAIESGDEEVSVHTMTISNSVADDYYFYNGTFNDLLDALTEDDSDDGFSNYDSLGDQIDLANGSGNTYYVINSSTDMQIYRWVNETNDNDYLSHVMTINDMNVTGATQLASYITSNEYHVI